MLLCRDASAPDSHNNATSLDSTFLQMDLKADTSLAELFKTSDRQGMVYTKRETRERTMSMYSLHSDDNNQHGEQRF